MDPMRQQLLEQYKLNTVNALIYGPNDMRGMAAVENIRQILKQLPPNDPDIRQIDHELLTKQAYASSGVQVTSQKIQYHPHKGGIRNE